MRFGAAFWVQRTDWPSLRAAVLEAEAAGFDSIWIDDHLLCDEGDWSSDKLEGWGVASAVAALTVRATIGHLVVANTFRNPGITAKQAVTLDHLSGGRAVLGIGGAWFEREHEAFGLDFGSGFGERLDRLAESVEVITRLLAGERLTFSGRFYTLRDAVCAPLPLQERLPILIGGSGPRKTLPLVARYASLWNAYGTPEALAAKDALLRERCAEIGRDPAEIQRMVNHNVVIRDDVAAAERAWEAYVRTGVDAEERELIGGPPEAVAAALRRYVHIGFDHVVWILRAPWDLETIRRLPEVRAIFEAAAPKRT
jgi:alkanesulfonate monooxygenase SsuD/methylene tetrahydromethanopterin reductase-like flavin-dependent oxidoreductase (luciferase family)